ncbi:hypothetical protein J4204_06215 [Candidatus Woesearchaeota archaeon]|nr:hypothetical protein [Candidatus Woesearchaeota archaeon]
MEEILLKCPKCKEKLFSVSIKEKELIINKGQMIDGNILDLISESTKRVIQQEMFLSSI